VVENIFKELYMGKIRVIFFSKRRKIAFI